MSEENTKKSGLDLKPAQIAAGALAAVTAAYLGSTLNVAGTIAGAAVASVVSTIGSALYQSSIERTRESVRRVGGKAWVVKPVEGETASASEAEAGAETSADAGGEPRGTRRWPKIAVGALLVFVLGMLAVTGLEWVRGAPLSGGDRGTSVGAVVGKPTERRQQSPTPSVTSPPVTSGPSSTTTPAPGTTSSAPTTTTESSPPGSSAQQSAPPSSTTGQTSAQTPSQPTPVPPPDLGTTG